MIYTEIVGNRTLNYTAKMVNAKGFMWKLIWIVFSFI